MNGKKTKIFAIALLLLVVVKFDSYSGYNKTNEELKIVETYNFGLDNNKDQTIYDENKLYCISSEGFIFVSNVNQHNICKFTLKGKFVKRFGKKGEGPGDLYFPGSLSILDNEFLVIGEYPETKRLSIFDLNGKFIKIFKTLKSNLLCIGTLDNFIFYMNEEYFRTNTSEFNGKKTLFYIKNLTTQKEKLFYTYKSDRAGYSDRINYISDYSLGIINGNILVEKSPKGNLFIANSNSDVFNIYSNEGKLIRKIQLKVPKRIVTQDIINSYKFESMSNVKKRMNSMRLPDSTKKKIINGHNKMPFEKFFGKSLPYYDTFLIDSNENILLIKDRFNKTITLALYSSKNGDLLKQKIYTNKRFKFRSKNLKISKFGLFGFFQDNESDEVDIKILKFDWDI